MSALGVAPGIAPGGTLTFAGSLVALRAPGALTPVSGLRICVVATAAAFGDPERAVAEVRDLGVWGGADVRVVSALDRRSAEADETLAEVGAADLVLLIDGAVLHARSVWRGSALADVMATKSVVATGAVGSVLGATMIDPRGGAPTTGVGFFHGVVLTIPASPDQMARTRNLVGAEQTLVELGPRGVVVYDGAWRVVADDLVVSRGAVATSL